MLKNYLALVGIAQNLQLGETSEGEGFYLRHLGEIVARFVEQIVWADQRIDARETEAIESLIRIDASQGGSLAECLRNPCGDLRDLASKPMLLQACEARDLREGTRITGLALDAFESLALSLMASDREIAEAEVELFQSVLGSWRKETAPEDR